MKWVQLQHLKAHYRTNYLISAEAFNISTSYYYCEHKLLKRHASKLKLIIQLISSDTGSNWVDVNGVYGNGRAIAAVAVLLVHLTIRLMEPGGSMPHSQVLSNLSRINPIPRIDTHFFKVHSNIVLPSIVIIACIIFLMAYINTGFALNYLCT